jgi:anti-sigma B factor antagonist
VASLPNFRIHTEQADSGTTIRLAGELDSATCGELTDAFERLLEGDPSGSVVFDLAGVSFVDSAGMRAIIVTEQIARERGIGLTIVPTAGPVTDLLHMTGLAERVALAPRSGDPPPPVPFLERIDLELAREPTAPGQARRELREAVAGRAGEPDRATLTLLTSELVTNAVIHPDPHADGPIGLRITTYPGRVRVEVVDAGRGFDASTLPHKPREAGGHGLVVVEGLSSRWGTHPAQTDGVDGFCVWFELDLDSTAADAPDQLSAPSLSQQ